MLKFPWNESEINSEMDSAQLQVAKNLGVTVDNQEFAQTISDIAAKIVFYKGMREWLRQNNGQLFIQFDQIQELCKSYLLNISEKIKSRENELYKLIIPAFPSNFKDIENLNDDSTAKEIRSVFYSGIRAWENEHNRKISSIDEITILWSSYLIKLPENLKIKAEKLTSFILYTPISLLKKAPGNEFFRDFMTAYVKLAIIDQATNKEVNVAPRGEREDFFGCITVIENDETIILTANVSEGRDFQSFENFSKSKAVGSDENNKFHTFLKYAHPNVKFDKKTIKKAIFEYVDAFRNEFKTVMNDQSIQAAIDCGAASPAKILELLSGRYGYYLDAYVFDNKEIPLNERVNFNQTFGSIFSKLSTGFAEYYENKNFVDVEHLIEDFARYLEDAAGIAFIPVVTKAQIKRKMYVYPAITLLQREPVDLQKTSLTFMPGYNPDLSLRQAYTSPEHSLNIENSSLNPLSTANLVASGLSDEDILTTFYTSNILYFLKIDRSEADSRFGRVITDANRLVWDEWVKTYAPQYIKDSLNNEERYQILRNRVSYDNQQLMEVLISEKQKDINFKTEYFNPSMQNSEILKKQLAAIAILWMYPKILNIPTINATDTQKDQFSELYAIDNITRIRLSLNWIQQQGDLDTNILKYYDENCVKIEEDLFHENREKMLRTLLPLFYNKPLSSKTESNVEAILLLYHQVPDQLFLSIIKDLWPTWDVKERQKAITSLLDNNSELLVEMASYIKETVPQFMYDIMDAINDYPYSSLQKINYKLRPHTSKWHEVMLKIMPDLLTSIENLPEGNNRSELSKAYVYALEWTASKSDNSLLNAATKTRFSNEKIHNSTPSDLMNTTGSFFESGLLNALNERSRGEDVVLPIFFDDNRVLEYLLAYLNTLHTNFGNEFGGQNSIRQILLNTKLTLIEKLNQLGAIAQGKLNGKLETNPRAKKITEFYTGLQNFTRINEEGLHSTFTQFLIKIREIPENVKNIEHYKQREVLLNQSKQTLDSKIKSRQQAAKYKKTDFTTLYKQWVEYIIDKEEVFPTDISILMTMPTQQDILNCYHYINAHPKLSSGQKEEFYAVLKENCIKSNRDGNIFWHAVISPNNETVKNNLNDTVSVKEKIPDNLEVNHIAELEKTPIIASSEHFKRDSVYSMPTSKEAPILKTPEDRITHLKEINHLLLKKNLPQILEIYASENASVIDKEYIALEIASRCKGRLIDLAKILKNFNKNVFSAFFSGSATPTGINNVIMLINSNAPTVKVLEALKEEAAKRSGITNHTLSRNKTTQVAYEIINDFFKNDNSYGNKNLDDLIQKINTDCFTVISSEEKSSNRMTVTIATKS